MHTNKWRNSQKMDKQLLKVIRKLNSMERQGFDITFKSIVQNMHRQEHTIKEIQDVTLSLMGVYKERKQITRVIRGLTKESTLYMK